MTAARLAANGIPHASFGLTARLRLGRAKGKPSEGRGALATSNRTNSGPAVSSRKWLSIAACCAVITLITIPFGLPVLAASIDVGSDLRIQVPLKSWKDLRDENLIVQRFDYSCGAAVLATLMRYSYGHEVTELDILTDVFETLSGDEEGVRREEGLSLLDLQRVAEARGFRAQGFKLLPEHLPRLKGPVIVFISPRGYDHFAVLRGVRGDRVYLADPSRGNLRQPAYRFLDDWLGDDGKGIIFVIEPEDGSGDYDYALKSLGDGLTQPELLTARQMVKVGNPFVRLPELMR